MKKLIQKLFNKSTESPTNQSEHGSQNPAPTPVNQMAQTYQFGDLTFHHESLSEFESSFPYPNDFFEEDLIKVTIGEEDSVREEHIELISRVRKELPQLLPQIVQRLLEYEEIEDIAAIKNHAKQPTIALMIDEEFDGQSWCFSVEWDNYKGIYQDFEELEFSDIWGAS